MALLPARGFSLAVTIASMAVAACTFGDFTLDAGPDDAAPIDAFASDATPADASPADASPADASPADASPADASPADASPPDAAGPPGDAGPHPIGPLGGGLATLMGDSKAGFANGTREFALVRNPVNVQVGPNGNIFVADFGNDAIREVTPTGDTTTLVSQAGFSRPFGMAFTPAGDFYVQTDRNSVGANTGALWQVALDTGVATLILDNAGRLRAIDSLSDGRLVVGDAANNTLQIYNPVGGTLTPLAGASGQAGFADGTGSAARFDQMRDLIVTSTDEIFITDSTNNRIRHVTLAGVVTTVAGNGVEATIDGAALTGSLYHPSGLALNGDGILYIGEFDTGIIRRLSGGTLTTIAGSSPGYADNIDPLLGLMFSTEGLDFAEPDLLYISDGNSGGGLPFNRVRRLTITN